MNIDTTHKELPDALEEIRSGNIFDVPDAYFEDLDKRIFDTVRQKPNPTSNHGFVRLLKYWPVAASVALLVSIGWWISREGWKDGENMTEAVSLHGYIQDHIMEYDIETLVSLLPEEAAADLSPGETEELKTYIIENIEDFETLIY